MKKLFQCITLFLLALFIQESAIARMPDVELTKAEAAFVKAHPEILLAGGISFAPFLMQNKSGKIFGHDVDIVNLVALRTGLKISIELGIWQEIQERAKNRELDGLLTASPTKERELYYNISEPYIHLTPLVIVKRDNPEEIHALKDISGKRVALQRGNAFKDILEKDVKDFEAIYFDSIQDVIKAVVSEKADCTLFEESVFYVARQLGLENMIEGAFATAGATYSHFQLRNDWPELVTIINKGIKSISRSEMLEIRNRWLAVKMGNTGNSGKIQLTSAEKIYLAEKGTIKVCIDPNWMPYEHINEEGVYEGMSADYLKIFSARLGVPVEILPTSSWSETLDAVKNGQCDIIPLAKASEKRRSYLNFTTPYLSFPYVIATKKAEFFIEDIGQALDKTYAVTRDYLVINELRQKYPKIKLLEVNNNIEGIQKVVSGEAYGYIDATAALNYVLYQENITAIKIAGKLPMGFELGVASRKDEPLLHDLFQKAVSTLTQAEKRRIHDKWIAVNVHKIVDYALLWKILGLITIIIAILVESRRRVAKANQKLSTLNLELVTALEENKTLKGIIPICMHCKEIKDDKGSWNQLEKYISEHSEAQFSHGLCDKCAEKYYSDE